MGVPVNGVTEAITITALRRMGPHMQGAPGVPIGAPPTSMTAILDVGGSRQGGQGGGGHGHHHRGGPFRPQRPVNHVNEMNTVNQDEYSLPEELPEELHELLMDETYELDDNYGHDCDVFCADAMQVQTRGRKLMNDVKKARGYFQRSEPLTNDQKIEREARLKKMMATAPCRGCGAFGH